MLNDPSIGHILKIRIFQIIFVLVTGILAYSNTLNVPFQLDDTYNIEQNPIIMDPIYFISPSEAKVFRKERQEILIPGVVK